jgi:hypothetical protein
VRLSVYLFKGCLDSYPELGNQILNQIDFGDQKKSTKDNDFDEQKEPRDYLSKDITPEWFGKDFLDFIFGVEDLRKRCSESDN